MDDLISRQAAIEAADSIIARDTSGENAVVEAMKAWKHCIEGLPSAQPERKKGKWIEDGYYNLPAVCCYCGELGKRFWNYCPSCGTDMRMEANDE